MMDDQQRRGAGLEVRRQVMGPEYVERAMGSADDFTAEFQDYLNTQCWGIVWTRPGLDHRTRSMLVLAMLAATNKWTEFKGHILGALRNGVTPDELREELLQMAVYLGVPTAVEAFRAAQPVVAEWRASHRG